MKTLTCPVCAGELRETPRHGILIDTCQRCRGVWLDRGELEKLAAAVGEPDESKSGFLASAMAALGDRNRRRHDDDDDDHHRRGYRYDKRYKKRKSLLDFFD